MRSRRRVVKAMPIPPNARPATHVQIHQPRSLSLSLSVNGSKTKSATNHINVPTRMVFTASRSSGITCSSDSSPGGECLATFRSYRSSQPGTASLRCSGGSQSQTMDRSAGPLGFRRLGCGGCALVAAPWSTRRKPQARFHRGLARFRPSCGGTRRRVRVRAPEASRRAARWFVAR